jgi:hypothetical protein
LRHESAESLLRLAQVKLLNTDEFYRQTTSKKDKYSNQFKCSPIQHLAVLGNLLSLEISAMSEDATELSSSHMRVVAAISDDRESVFTMQTAEPVLVMAAMQLFANGYVSWSRAISDFEATLRTTTKIGFRGELGCQLLCLLAWQNMTASLSREALFNFPAMPVIDFVKGLLGTQLESVELRSETQTTDFRTVCEGVRRLQEAGALQTKILSILKGEFDDHYWLEKHVGFREKDVEEFYESLAMLLRTGITHADLLKQFFLSISRSVWQSMLEKLNSRGLVRVYGFVKTFSKPSKAMLADFFVRGVAIYCAEYHTSVDLIIPMFCPSVCDGADLRQLPVTEEDMTAFVLQVKLQRYFLDGTERNSWIDSLLDLAWLVDEQRPFVALLCEFGPVENLGQNSHEVGLREVRQKVLTNSSKKKRGSDGGPRPQIPVYSPELPTRGFVAMSRGLSVRNILPHDGELLRVFRTLLDSMINPIATSLIYAEELPFIEVMFKDCVYHSQV